MAKTKNALFSITAKGKVGSLVIENNKKTQYAKANIKPKDRKTPKQLEKRKRYGQAVQAWHALPPDMKEVFDIKAKLNRMSGFNLFLKYFTTIWIIATYGVGIYGVNRYGKKEE